MRELFKALSELETRLMEQYGVSLNEAMALCCIGGDTLTASVISENTGLSASHTSKVIRSIEEKELIVRNLGDKDKRQMHFTLSDKGHECLEALKANEIEDVYKRQVTLGASMCFASPFSTPPNALVMPAGQYTFMDYVKVGLPLQIIMGIEMCIRDSLYADGWILQ